VNNVPSFTKGADQTVSEDSPAQTVNDWASDISAGPANESGQTVLFNVTGNTEPGLFSAGPAVDSSGTLTYTLAANANGSATITIEAQDDGGIANSGVDTSASQTFVINLTAVNNAPSFTKGADQTVSEDAGAQTVAGWASDISAGPANESGQTVSFNVTGNTNSGLFSAAPAVDSSGTLTYTLAANANGSATITIEAQDDGGIANGGVDTSASQTFVINVTAVADKPEITSNGGGATAAINVAENSTAVTDVNSVDAEGETENGGGLGYGLSGDDASQFSINPAGILAFIDPPDFENPTDNGTNGIYDVTVTVTDSGGLTDSQALAVTVTNVAGGNITILKNIVGGGFADMDFNFTFAGSPFAISQNDGGGFTQIDIPPGTYNVTETVPAAWSLSSIECGVDQNNTGATNGINIVLEANENVVCTFNNTPDPGSIVIVLDTDPNAAQDFAFTTTGDLVPATFSLDDDADGTLAKTQSFSSVPPGDYSVSQTLVANYDLTMACTDPTTNTSTAGTTASIAVAPGETVTCTFTNTFAPPLVTANATGILNDTGIVFSGNETSGNNSNTDPAIDQCVASTQGGDNQFARQDCSFGRDVSDVNDEDGVAGFSFLKVSSDGLPMLASESSHACVKDNVTGLMWEVKTDDNGLHDKDDSYTWYNTESTENGGADGTLNGGSCFSGVSCDTQGFVTAVNVAGLCAYNDWRMPTVTELQGLLNYQKIDSTNLMIDTTFFPNTKHSFFWSASPLAGNADFVWGVDFGDGDVNDDLNSRAQTVRLVRGGQ
jgi:hypothetical protein